MSRKLKGLHRRDVAGILPHTGCFLLPRNLEIFIDSDGGIETLCAKSVLLIKKNNFFLKRHFGCMPGVILIELLNQVAALLIMVEKEITGEPVVCRLDDPGPDFGKFKTVAGDNLTATVVLTKYKRGMFYLQGKIINQRGLKVLETGIVGAAAEKKSIPSAEVTADMSTLGNGDLS